MSSPGNKLDTLGNKSDTSPSEQAISMQVDETTLFASVRINNGDPNHHGDSWENLMRDGPYRIATAHLRAHSEIVVTNGKVVIPWHQVRELRLPQDGEDTWWNTKRS